MALHGWRDEKKRFEMKATMYCREHLHRISLLRDRAQLRAEKREKLNYNENGFFFSLFFFPSYQNNWILHHSLYFVRAFFRVANQKQFVSCSFNDYMHASGLFYRFSDSDSATGARICIFGKANFILIKLIRNQQKFAKVT